MANLTPTEQSRLGIVRPELMALLLALMDQAGARFGFTLAVPEDGGLRSTSKQAALYADSLAQGGGQLAYPVGKPGTSFHEFGAAFDVQIVKGGHDGTGHGTDDDYRALADLGEALGLVAGYYYAARGEGQKDPYHFHLAEALSTSKARWEAMQTAGFTLTREVLSRRLSSLSLSSRSSRT
jgi:hypothetical protein